MQSPATLTIKVRDIYQKKIHYKFHSFSTLLLPLPHFSHFLHFRSTVIDWEWACTPENIWQYLDTLLEKEMATHSSILAWKIPRKEEPGRLQSMRSQRDGHTCLLLLLLRSRFSRVRLCATSSAAAHQAPLSLGFSRQEQWRGLPLPSPLDPL